jgi:hypothetical protein
VWVPTLRTTSLLRAVRCEAALPVVVMSTTKRRRSQRSEEHCTSLAVGGCVRPALPYVARLRGCSGVYTQDLTMAAFHQRSQMVQCDPTRGRFMAVRGSPGFT